MISLIDFQERVTTGPVAEPDDFDLELAFTVRDLVEKYDIHYDPEQLVVDDRTADAIFEAAVEHLSTVGVYFMSSERVLQYEEEEIRQFAEESKDDPACVVLGGPKDRMKLRHRKSDDTWAPTNYAGPAGVADREWFTPYAQSFAQEETVAGMGINPCLARLGDLDPKAGTLSEVEVALWEQEALRTALQRAGRPEMNLGLLCTASTPSATMAVMSSKYRDHTNTQIGIHIMPEQKLDWGRFLMSQYCEIAGVEPWQSSMSCLGGMCRDAAEVAVVMVANALGQLSYAHGGSVSYFPSHLDGTWATKPSHWAFSGAARASERHLGLAVGTSISGITPAWRTPLSLFQSAAVVVTAVASGMSYAWIAGHTGLEARLIGQMMNGCAGMPADRANELAQKIMLRVDELLPKVTDQLPFPEAYDTRTVKPKPVYEKSMLDTRDELMAMGMPFSE
ncbi:MAG: monomethylamine:corrinoid methyltransferase [Deltaproteobacteria bacterium]|nr:monomethylamine:corrinoid methyltransferase [Deltaproteobacteria bacterium]